MTSRAGGGHGIGSVEDHVLVLGLSRLICLHTCVPQALDKLGPIGIVQGNGASIAAFSAGNSEEVSCLGEGNPAVLDSCPSAVGCNKGIRRCSGIAGRLELCRILALSCKDDIRVGK